MSPFVAGEVQFWRMDPGTWSPVLRAVKEAGIPVVSTYLSWRRHEPTEGELDLDGATDPRLDVPRFLDLCAEYDLAVQLKPGPWICAEEPGGGYPDWLLAQRDLLALDDLGDPVLGYNPPFQHHVPSYADERYRAAAARWLQSVWRRLGDHAGPGGPIVAVQLDNEPSICFQDSLFGGDYHPVAVAAFRSWLADRYRTQEEFEASWREPGVTFDTAEPPRRPDDGTSIVVDARVDDWIRFKGAYIADHLAFLRQVTDGAVGGRLTLTVNTITHPVHDVPVGHDLVRRATGALVGEDHYYLPPLDMDDVHRLARSAATARAAGEPLPWVPELQAGIWRSPGEEVGYPDPTPDEQEIWWGSAVALGFGGMNLYMLANRENWEHAPITEAGDRSAFASPVLRLTQLAERHPGALTGTTTPDVVVAWHRPDARAAYAVTGTARVPDVPWANGSLTAAYHAWDECLRDLLRRGYRYDLWDTETEPDPAPGLPVIVPAGAGIPAATLGRLVAAGRRVIRLPDAATALPSDVTRAVALLDDEGEPVPGAIVGTRISPSAEYLHVVGLADIGIAHLAFADHRTGVLTDVAGNASLDCRAGRTDLHVRRGHTTYLWEPRIAPA